MSNKHDESVGIDTDAIETNAGKFLCGAEAIRAYLVEQGLPDTTDPYYLKKTGWPIGSSSGGKGGFLLAIKHRLNRHLEKLASS